MLPERIAKAVTAALEDLGVCVACSEQAIEITAGEVKTQSGKSYPADLAVWAAGIKGADLLGNLDGLETNHINQLVVQPTLQTTRDPDIFALGDCSAFPRKGKQRPVPPAAQAAHQEASHLLGSMALRMRGRPLTPSATATSVLSCRSANTALSDADGFSLGQELSRRGVVRAADVPVAVQDAPVRAPWSDRGRARYAGAPPQRGTEPSVKLH